MADQDFRAKVQKHWRNAIFKTFGATPDRWTEVRGSALTLRTISPFLYGHMAHAFMPVSGGNDFEAVAQGAEPGTLEFKSGESTFYVLKPGVLRFGYVEAAPEESFFLLDAARLEPTGMEPGPRDGREELTEHPPRSMEYVDHNAALHGFAGYDSEGGEIPLPADSRTLLRYTSGRFMITSQVSLWNGDEVVDNAYGAPHGTAEPDEIMEMIEAAVSRAGGRGR